jgi:hypothetical protein
MNGIETIRLCPSVSRCIQTQKCIIKNKKKNRSEMQKGADSRSFLAGLFSQQAKRKEAAGYIFNDMSCVKHVLYAITDLISRRMIAATSALLAVSCGAKLLPSGGIRLRSVKRLCVKPRVGK